MNVCTTTRQSVSCLKFLEKSMKPEDKKKFYNRVRRTCLKHGIDIFYGGQIHNYNWVQLVKDGFVLFEQNSQDRGFPLQIDWKELHEKLAGIEYTGGVK